MSSRNNEAVGGTLAVLLLSALLSSPPRSDQGREQRPAKIRPSAATSNLGGDRHEHSALRNRTFVERKWADRPSRSIAVCTFNIKWLGHYKDKQHASLAAMLQSFDAVVVQELVAPPYEGQFPDGTDFKPSEKSAAFFDAMLGAGFEYWLSEEDTGPGQVQHTNAPSTEWFVAFYNPARLSRAEDLPHGFVDEDHYQNDVYARVPYAFSFRSADGLLDFVLVSVHLQPNKDDEAKELRQEELLTVSSWIEENAASEQDFLILGDMNIYDEEELISATPEGFTSLNLICQPTNTSPKDPRPYDHVLFRPAFTPEIATDSFRILDLIEEMRGRWTLRSKYPGSPYDSRKFPTFYSDHHPVAFWLTLPTIDDD